MSKLKSSEREKRSEHLKQSVPDTGQGPAGDLGSDADVGSTSGSGNNEKTQKGKQKTPIPIKRKDKPDVRS